MPCWPANSFTQVDATLVVALRTQRRPPGGGSGSGSGRLPLKRLRTLRVMVVSDAPAVDDTEKVTRCSPLSGGQVALNAVAHCASDGFSALGGEVPFQ